MVWISKCTLANRSDQIVSNNHVEEKYEHQGAGIFWRGVGRVEEGEFRRDTGEPRDVSFTAQGFCGTCSMGGTCEKEQHSPEKYARVRVLRENQVQLKQ